MPATDRLRMVVLGDSVLWGQGLAAEHKIGDRVATMLNARMNPSRQVELVANLAHSGATIGVRDDGSRDTGLAPPGHVGLVQEVNWSYPTILDQVEAFVGNGDQIGLVLLDGGINDVNVRRILPSVDDDVLAQRIDLHCRQHMGRLLESALSRFPKATVVVTGYYPIVSDLSVLTDFNVVRWLLEALGLVNPLVGAFAGLTLQAIQHRLAANFALFQEHSDCALARAVDAANRRIASESPQASRRVLLVTPAFERGHAVLAPDALLFGLNALTGKPLDDVQDQRGLACDAAYLTDPVGRQICRRASAGHPTRKGAQRYADEIVAALDGAGFSGADTKFPKGFLWGSATAAYQVEGGITNNDWHVFTTRDAIAKRVRLVGEAVGLHDIALQPPGEAIGHRDLETLRQDLDRMAALGFNAYRFSVEWSRIEPVRPGRAPSAAGEAALQYYQTVVQEVRSRAMEPVVTLNHLTLPRWVLAPPVNPLPDLDDDFMASLRGWESTATVDAFVAFVGRVVGRLSPQVKCWITLNEPVASMIGVGYLAGLWSPGLMSGERGRSAYFNLLRAHARAYDAIKAAVANDPRVQVGLAHAMMHPRAADPRDLNLVDRTCSPEALAQFDYFFNWHLIDTLTRDRVNVSLDARYRDPELMERDARQAVDSAEMRLRQLLADVRVHVRLAQERLDDATAWFNSAATREAAFVAWRRAYGDQAANAVPAQIQAEARAAAQAALDVCKPAVLVTLAALAVAARGLDGLLQRAVDLDDFVDHAAGAVADAIRHALARTIGAWGLPAHLLIPDQAMLVDAAAALVRQARTVFAAAFDALAQRRSLEASLQAARDKLPRAQAALQDILQTLANGHQASDAFFGLPFRPRLDFIGVNYYRGVQVYAGRAFQLATAATQSAYTGAQFTQNLSETMEAHPLLNDLQWEVYPRGLFELIQRITHDFNRLPVLVTENGIPEIRDRCRAAYIVAHLEQLQRAQREGARLLGYLHWSIADNFEWFENYRPHARFGLFGIDRTSGPPHPRHMTEGALALYRATAERDVGGLALRFGNFHPRGWAVDTPLRSPARCVIGNFEPGPLVPAGQGLSLLFSRATDDTLLILGHEPDRGLWWQARGHVVDSGELSFALPVGAFRDSNSTRLSFTGRLDSAGLTGELSATGGRKQSFKGRTWRVVGNWLSDANPHVLQVFAYEPGPSAATRVKLMHMQHRMQTWTVADIATVDPDRISITFDLLPGRAVNLASLEANLDAASGRLVGHLSSRGQRSDWIARRMPDGLPW